MKRIFLIAIAALFCVTASAQRVEKNERNEKGVRTIETGTRAFYADGKMNICGLNYSEAKGEEWYQLILFFSGQSSKWLVRNGQELMMKDVSGNVATITPPVAASNSISGGKYVTTIMYYLTNEQADYIRNGLTKLRINMTYTQNESTYLFDVELPEDITTHLKKAIKNIEKTIPQPVTVDKSVF
jgi:hypothetical protein